jgi:hypothetical protein
MKRSLLFCVVAFVSFLSPVQKPFGQDLTGLTETHSAITNSVIRGKPLDEKVSLDLQSKLKEEASPDLQKELKSAVGTSDPSHRLTNREALEVIEAEVDKRVPKVQVTIDCSPARCSVKYRPIVEDVGWRDAGTTKVSLKMDPKTYVFAYSCGKVRLSKTLECMSDQSFTFQCPEPALSGRR